MVQSTRQTTKRKSKRLNKKRRAEKAENTIKHNVAPIRKSNRLVTNLDITKILYEAEVDKSSSQATTTNNNDHEMRPVHTQSLLLPAELNCADLEEQQLKRIGLFSCYCCDNYRADKFCKLKGNRQSLVNQKKYGCRRTNKIRVKVIFSSRHSSNQIKNDTPTLTDVLPPKPSKTVNRKIGQQRRCNNERKQRILGEKMRVENMKSKVILCEEINKNTEELETKHTCEKNE